jgi:DNA-binding response OmpR family regulator
VSARILLAEDDPTLLEVLRDALAGEGFTVLEARDGEAALGRARTEALDLLILDWALPRMSGIDVCRTVRAESDLPIIMLTARATEVDRVLGLELGADDYVTKPFSMAELIGRTRALLRRRELDRGSSAASVRSVGGVRLDHASHEVTVDGAPVTLTPSEYRLLALLSEHPNRAFTRAEIMEHLSRSPFVGDARAADGHVARLRRKIERKDGSPERIVTVRDVGYKLVAP